MDYRPHARPSRLLASTPSDPTRETVVSRTYRTRTIASLDAAPNPAALPARTRT
jgi:hypothetical protein